MSSTSEIHPIRRKILLNLSKANSLKFNDIKNFDIDPRNFVYHLKKLRDQALVTYNKKTSKYSLTTLGKRLLDNASIKKGIEKVPIDIFIGLLIEKDKKILTVKRDSAPYLNYIGIPIFDVHIDKFIHESAQQALESLKLEGTLAHILVNETIYKNRENQVLTHTNMHVFYCNDTKGNPPPSNIEGDLSWMSIDKLLNQEKTYKDTETILSRLRVNHKTESESKNNMKFKKIEWVTNIDRQSEY